MHTDGVASTHDVQLCVAPPLGPLHLPSPAVPVRLPYQQHQAGDPPAPPGSPVGAESSGGS